MTKKLYRSSTDKVLVGICGGIAEYTEIDSTLIRIIFILLTVMGGGGILIYIILALVVPSKNSSETPAQEAADGLKSLAEKTHGWQLFIGLILVFIGVIALTKSAFPEFDIFPPARIFGPAILILIGLYFVVKHQK